MTKMAHLWGLPTIQPTEQAIGAALSVGVKPVGGGWPEEKDRFHIVTAKTRERKERGRKVEYRPHDPRFSAFNEADLETRQVFYGMLCYHREEECWHPNYGMYRFPSGDLANPKTKRFACVGNGQTAERWLAGAPAAIPCLGEGCPYRQERGDDKAPCQPRSRFWFIPRWLPSQGKAFARYLPDTSAKMLLGRPIMRLATQGREARDTFAGMIKTVRAQAEPLGGIPSLYGLPFEMTLSEGTNAEKKTRWPDITFTLDGDWFEWLRWVTTEFRQLKEAPPMVALGSASAAELDPEHVGAEHAAIVPYSAGPAVKPAVTAVAEVVSCDLCRGKREVNAIQPDQPPVPCPKCVGEAQPAVEGPDDPAGEPAQAEASSPPPATPDSRSLEGEGPKPPISPSPPPGPAFPVIGKEGAERLQELAVKYRELAPRLIPFSLTEIVSLAGQGTEPAENLTRDAANKVAAWMKAEAAKMPKGES